VTRSTDIQYPEYRESPGSVQSGSAGPTESISQSGNRLPQVRLERRHPKLTHHALGQKHHARLTLAQLRKCQAKRALGIAVAALGPVEPDRGVKMIAQIFNGRGQIRLTVSPMMKNGRMKSTGRQHTLPTDSDSRVTDAPGSRSHDVVRPLTMLDPDGRPDTWLPRHFRDSLGSLRASIALFVLEAILSPPPRPHRNLGSSIRSSTSCSN
jgi:hypothetical protein